MSDHRIYLGDGVDADFDGFNIILSTFNPETKVSNKICLDCHALHNLKLYAKSKGFSFKGDELEDE